MNNAESFLSILGLSDNDKKRLCQCITCKHNPEVCGCDESNEDENGMCKEWIGKMIESEEE